MVSAVDEQGMLTEKLVRVAEDDEQVKCEKLSYRKRY